MGLTYNGRMGTIDGFSTVNFSGVLSTNTDTVKGDLQKPNFGIAMIDGEVFTVTLTGQNSVADSGEISGKITAMKASPAPEPSEVGMLVLCTVGLMGLMVRARKARAVGGTTM
jgi:hypothetical protein